MIDFELDLSSQACEPEGAYAVNRELNLAWSIIEETGANLFLTGRAGTGKTTFLKKLRQSTSKRMVVLAPTGVAAINASGSTIHSFFQIPFAPYLPGRGFLSEDKKFLNISQQKRQLIASLSLLVIDEISMVRPDTLDAVDSILRRLRQSSQPFGGLQLLLIGDLRQLPPVVKDDEWNLLKNHYASPYFFESQALKLTGYQTVELSTVYRQKDNHFLEILNKIRDGKIDLPTLDFLNSRCVVKENSVNEEGFIRLTTHNRRADDINEMRLAALKASEFTYCAQTEGTFPESAFPAEKILRLKEGAQVMFVKNDSGSSRKYYNGLIGTVFSLSEEKIRVRLRHSQEIIDVVPVEWENTRYVIDELTKNVAQEKIGVFRQYPLQLAWAITIHKSQGLTFDKAIIDATYSFAPGQTYVALSRCRSLDGLRLDAPVPPRAVIIDKEVNDFLKYCEDNYPDPERVETLKNNYLYSLFLELFDFSSLKRFYNDFSRYALEYIAPMQRDAEKEIYDHATRIENDIMEVAKKFVSSRNPDSLAKDLSMMNSPLQERIKKGAKYFLTQLEEIENFIDRLPKDIDNKTYSKRLENVYAPLSFHIRLKKKTLTAFSSLNFTSPVYLGVKSKAVIELEKHSRKRNSTNFVKERTPKKEKKPKGYSVHETLKLFREGKDIETIAKERGLQVSTIADHFCKLIEDDKVKPREIVNPELIEKIKNICAENSGLSYSEKLMKVNSELSVPIPSYLLKIYLYSPAY